MKNAAKQQRIDENGNKRLAIMLHISRFYSFLLVIMTSHGCVYTADRLCSHCITNSVAWIGRWCFKHFTLKTFRQTPDVTSLFHWWDCCCIFLINNLIWIMKGYCVNLEQQTKDNKLFRKVRDDIEHSNHSSSRYYILPSTCSSFWCVFLPIRSWYVVITRTILLEWRKRWTKSRVYRSSLTVLLIMIIWCLYFQC